MPTSSSTPGVSGSGSSTSSTSKPEIPWAFHECPTETLVVLISHMLNLLIQHNDQVILTPDSLTRFHSKSAPDIKVLDYLNRIVKYTNMEKIPLLSLLAYIDVTCTNNPTFTLSSLTVHRFLIAGVCAGSKAQCDVFCTNSHYAKVGGININELNALEMEFLKVTQWDLCCKAELLQRYYTSLIKSHGGFVQADEPIDSPLKSLPHPKPIPSTTTPEVPTDLIPPTIAGAEQPLSSSSRQTPNPNLDSQPVDIPPPNKRSARRDSDIDTQSVPERGEVNRPAGLNGTSSAPDPDSGRMEVDDDISPPIDVDDPSSPASSSVPSSSRSSLRTRNVSMTQLDPSAVTAASPRIDMTTASGRVVMQVDEDGSGGVTSPEPDQEVKGAHHAGSGGGKLLKSLVGGIFKRRDSAHHSDPPAPPPPPSHDNSRNGNANGNGNRLIPPHQSPGRRVKSPLMTTIPQGEPPAMAASVTPRVRNREETSGF